MRPLPFAAALALTAALVACKDKPDAPAEAEPDAPAQPSPETAEPAAAPEPAKAKPGRAPATEEERAAVIATEGAARKLGGILKDRVKEAMTAGAPKSAASTCAELAQKLTGEVREVTGVAVGRASTRLRNPKNAPPPWVDRWLREHESAPASAAEPERWIVDDPDGAVARVILPIGVEPLCLQCHGPKDSLDSGVREVLDSRYPSDAATGYAVGDLRGALWAERAVAADVAAGPVDGLSPQGAG
ncbi:MAG: DUF3365 domain-containing protein [Myxococcales bacterium]|nr:DUF3365 domain-containing protein [Myxococcales bacterium]